MNENINDDHTSTSSKKRKIKDLISSIKIRKSSEDINDPRFKEPLVKYPESWQRVVVNKSYTSKSVRPADIHYIYITDKDLETEKKYKLRTYGEVAEKLQVFEDNLKFNNKSPSGLTLNNFTFVPKSLGINDEAKEIVCTAKSRDKKGNENNLLENVSLVNDSLSSIDESSIDETYFFIATNEQTCTLDVSPEIINNKKAINLRRPMKPRLKMNEPNKQERSSQLAAMVDNNEESKKDVSIIDDEIPKLETKNASYAEDNDSEEIFLKEVNNIQRSSNAEIETKLKKFLDNKINKIRLEESKIQSILLNEIKNLEALSESKKKDFEELKKIYESDILNLKTNSDLEINRLKLEINILQKEKNNLQQNCNRLQTQVNDLKKDLKTIGNVSQKYY